MMPVGSLNASLLSSFPAVPCRLPSTINTLPSGENLKTTCPFTSTHQILPSGSTRMPCVVRNSPSPQLRMKFPLRSNSITGCAPRLNTQTLSCLSTATPDDSPRFQPGGSLAHPATTLCGSGGPDFSSPQSEEMEQAAR